MKGKDTCLVVVLLGAVLLVAAMLPDGQPIVRALLAALLRVVGVPLDNSGS